MPEKAVQVYHHNDSDGITSGAILSRAFERQGFTVRRFCFEKPYPAVLDKVFEQEGKILVFADFAGRIAPLLSALNQGRNLTLILDHHVAEASTDPRVINLDPDLFGLKGDRDISGSTTCYLFARTLDPDNRDLAHIAAIGAVGDGFFVDGALVSENRDVALEAARQGLIEIRRRETGEQYLLNGPSGQLPVIDFGDYLDVLGGVGYYSDGPSMGVGVCLEGVSPSRTGPSMSSRPSGRGSSTTRPGGCGQALQPDASYAVVSCRAALLSDGSQDDRRLLRRHQGHEPHRPGQVPRRFQIIPDGIPGFGAVPMRQVKISMRVSPAMETGDQSREGDGAARAASRGHAETRGVRRRVSSLTAATTVAIGKEEELIAEMESMLRGASHG